MQRVAGFTAKAPAAEVGRFQFGEFDQVMLLVESCLEDLLDGAIGRRAEVQCPTASGFEPLAPEALTQSQHTLRGPQVIEDTIAKQRLYQRSTGRADDRGLRQTPLRIAHQERHRIGRQVVLHGGLGAGLEQPGMHGDEFMVAVDA